MKDVLYLAWRYLSFHRVKTAILVTSIALIVYLPVGLNVLVGESARELTARANDLDQRASRDSAVSLLVPLYVGLWREEALEWIQGDGFRAGDIVNIIDPDVEWGVVAGTGVLHVARFHVQNSIERTQKQRRLIVVDN